MSVQEVVIGAYQLTFREGGGKGGLEIALIRLFDDLMVGLLILL